LCRLVVGATIAVYCAVNCVDLLALGFMSHAEHTEIRHKRQVTTETHNMQTHYTDNYTVWQGREAKVYYMAQT